MMAEAEATAATAGRQSLQLTCRKCEASFVFERLPGSRGPAPRYCAACRPIRSRHVGCCKHCGGSIAKEGKRARWCCDVCSVDRTRQREARRTERERAARPSKQCRDCGVAIGGWKPGGNIIRCTACRETAYLATRQRENVKRRKPPPTEEALEAARLRREQKEAEAKARRKRGEAIRKRVAALPWRQPSLTVAERFAIRYRLDPDFNLRERLRAAFKRKRQGIKLDLMLRSALVRGGRSPRAERFVGYTVAELRVHLERQFKRGMTWDRFCAGEIHIDHIRPLSSFDLSNPDELRAAWALPNLRPLWAKDNWAKAGRVVLLL